MKRILLILVLLAAGVSTLLTAGCAGAPSDRAPLHVGAARVEITPRVETFDDANGNGRYDAGEKFEDRNGNAKWDPVFLGGFGMARTALAVHDPLWVRAIVFEKRGGGRAAVVACDLVGLLHARVSRILDRIGRSPDLADLAGRVIVCSTHVHSGPDTLGLWGPFPGISGVSEEYVTRLEEAVIEALRAARSGAVAATLHAAAVEVPGVCKDIRPPDVRNETATGLLARDARGAPVAILVNFAMHPEGMGSKNRAVSSDYPHYVRERLERDFAGATAVFVSGDLGGMQTPDVKDHSWDEIRRAGETIAERLGAELAGAPALEVPDVRFASRPVELPLDNRRFAAAAKAGLFGRDYAGTLVAKEGRVRVVSQVAAVRLGEALLASVPGEALPEVGREVRALMNGRFRIVIGLGQDEIGYILPKADFDPNKYEESMSLGPETAPMLLDALKQLLKGF